LWAKFVKCLLGRWKLFHLVHQTTQPILQLYTQILLVWKLFPMWFVCLPPSHDNSLIFVGFSMYFSTTTSNDTNLFTLGLLNIISFLYPRFERDSPLFQLTNQTLRHGMLKSTIDYNEKFKKIIVRFQYFNFVNMRFQDLITLL